MADHLVPVFRIRRRVLFRAGGYAYGSHSDVLALGYYTEIACSVPDRHVWCIEWDGYEFGARAGFLLWRPRIEGRPGVSSCHAQRWWALARRARDLSHRQLRAACFSFVGTVSPPSCSRRLDVHRHFALLYREVRRA